MISPKMSANVNFDAQIWRIANEIDFHQITNYGCS